MYIVVAVRAFKAPINCCKLLAAPNDVGEFWGCTLRKRTVGAAVTGFSIDGTRCWTIFVGGLVTGTGRLSVEKTCRVIGNGSVLQKKPENSELWLNRLNSF